jgi:hypothetical protein
MWTVLMQFARHPVVRRVAITLFVALVDELKKPQRKR